MSRLRRPCVWIAALLAAAVIVGCAIQMRAPTCQPSPQEAELLRDYQRAERFRADGKLSEAHEVFLDLKRRLAQDDLRPARPVTRKNLARNIREIEKEIKESNRDAFERLVIIQQHNERAAQIEFEKGLAAYTEGRFDHARKLFSGALDFNPDHRKAARRLAETRDRMGLGRPEIRAIADQIQLETIRRQQEEIRLRNLIAAGQEARQRKDFDAAKAFFQQALIRLEIQQALPHDTGASYEKKARRALDTAKNEDLHSKATYSRLRNLMAAGKEARRRKAHEVAKAMFEQALVRLEIQDSLPSDVAAEMEENVRDQLACTDTEKSESDRAADERTETEARREAGRQIHERKDIRRKETQDLKDRAWAMINDHNYDGAIEALDRILHKDPRDPEAKWLRDRFQLRKHWKMEEGFREEGERRRSRILVDKEGKVIPDYKTLRFPPNWEEKERRAAGALTTGDTSEEIWVIERPPSSDAPVLGTSVPRRSRSSEKSPDGAYWDSDATDIPLQDSHWMTRAIPKRTWRPGSGVLVAKLPGRIERVPVPLKHTDVKGRVTGYIAAVDVTQKFHNPFSEKIEAEYVFPLPQNAAINEFIMTIGDRRIRGIIRERQEAQAIYREARARGHVASLLTQERPNIFIQKVANIEPGKAIDISITYFSTLDYRDGWYEFVFPMVVGPRFNPPGQRDGVGAVAHGKRGLSGQKTEVQYLKPGERSGHDIALAVEIDAGVAIEEIESVNHVVRKTRAGDAKMTVEIAALDSIPNKDFVLRYKVAGKRIKTALFTHRGERGGFFTLMLFPPEDLKSLKRAPMEMVFVLDCSGSMSGRPIEQAKNAARRALRSLRPGDTFQVIRFSNNASQLGPAPIQATPENVEKALAYVDSLSGSGGTMMIEGIKAALDFPHDQARLRVVAFLTDGYIGNESEILGEVSKRLGASRIFSFGVGTSVNRYLLQRMARLGRGTAAFVSLHEDAGKVMDRYFERTSHPAMTDIEIDWGTLAAVDVYPAAIPDLFAGAPVVVTGRFAGEPDSPVKLSGAVAGKTRTFTLPVNAAGPARHKGLAYVWARTKIADLMDRATHEGPDKLAPEIRQLALNFGLMSHYTSFIAVDSMARTAGDHGATVAVPVPMPEGVRYDTTVSQ